MRAVDHQSHDGAKRALRDRIAHDRHQVDLIVIAVVLVELDIGVTGDVERIGGDDLGPGEEPVQMRGDDLLQPGEHHAAGVRSACAVCGTGTKRGRVAGILILA